jgi:hypothetical protein
VVLAGITGWLLSYVALPPARPGAGVAPAAWR